MTQNKEKNTPFRKVAGDKKSDKKLKAAAFANWTFEYESTQTGEKKEMRSNRGFAIFTEGDYTDAKEKWLVEAAKARGGVLEIPVTLRIVVNNPEDLPAVDDIPVFS